MPIKLKVDTKLYTSDELSFWGKKEGKKIENV